MQTYINHLDINYTQESISLLVIHNGVDLEWIPELNEYLQDIFDDLPQDFKQAYYPVSHQVLMRPTGSTTHITTFNLRDSHKPTPLSTAITDKIFKIIYDPGFSGPELPQIIPTYNSVTIINYGG